MVHSTWLYIALQSSFVQKTSKKSKNHEYSRIFEKIAYFRTSWWIQISQVHEKKALEIVVHRMYVRKICSFKLYHLYLYWKRFLRLLRIRKIPSFMVHINRTCYQYTLLSRSAGNWFTLCTFCTLMVHVVNTWYKHRPYATKTATVKNFDMWLKQLVSTCEWYTTGTSY